MRADHGIRAWERYAELAQLLNRAETREFVPVLLATLKAEAGAVAAHLYLADVEERLLSVCGEAGEQKRSSERRVLIEGSSHGRAYQRGQAQRTRLAGSWAIIVPVLARAERIGVLEVRFPEEPPEEVQYLVSSIGVLVGYLIIAADRWTDEFHVARRRQNMTLAAELQWNLLPLSAFSSARISVGAALEPAYDIAGDCFDYSLGRRALLGGIFDGMGHGLRAARLAELAIGAYRNGRRNGLDLQAQARFIHQSVLDGSRQREFVTGQLAHIDLAEPTRSSIVNAGHPTPLLHRGNGPPKRLPLTVDLPFGMPFPNELTPQPMELEPGDRLVFFSDGVVEARPERGEFFGEERLVAALEEHRPKSPREAAREIISAVMAHRADALLDDATILILDVPA
jgi:stage II sporulation SpoE-like protein